MLPAKGMFLLLAVFYGATGHGSANNGMTYENAERRSWIPIKSCTSKEKYATYECAKAYDGIIEDESKNGWSHEGSTPQWVEFTLRESSKVNRVALKSLWKDFQYRPKGFKIELYKGGSWIKPQQVRIEHSDIKGEVSGNQINMKEKRHEVDVAFKEEVGVSKVKLTVTSNFDSSVVLSEVLIQYVPEWQACATVGGTQRGRDCIFPFVNPWTNAVHYACTNDFGLPPWCATRVNSDWTMTGYKFSGFCNSSCEVEEPSTCYTVWSAAKYEIYVNEKTKERRNCIFPFKYEGKWYTECKKQEMGGKQVPICATTVDRDGKLKDMGYCGPECPGSTVASQCVSAVGYKTSRNNRCVFPYYYDEKYYTSCDEGMFSGRKMCATGINYNTLEPIDNQWGFCGTEPCDDKACITVGGAHVGQTCKFPFRNKWTKELHYGCTTASLEQDVGNTNYAYASAPWCATDTGAGDEMISGKWGFCSKKCGLEEGTNCYVDDGTSMSATKKCIFPYVFKGLVNKQCTYVKGYLSCPIKVNSDGHAKESDMRRCGPSPTCFNATTINGNPITIGYLDVGSYTNSGSKELEIAFSFETGVEDSTESNWNVEASVTAGFDAFGASVEASVTAGGGGGASSSSSSHQSHSLTYKCPPRTRVVLSQQVLSSGVFESRTFKLILTETKIGRNREEVPTLRELKWEEISPNVISRKLN